MLPDFLREEDNAKVKVAKEGYVEKSLSGYLKVSQWFFKRSKSSFTRIDEWAKLLFLIWFSLLVSISDSILFLAVAFTFVLVVAAISKADIKALIVSSWGFVPLVTFIISIPYMLITKNIMPAILQVLKTGIIIMTGEVVIYNSRIDRLFKPFSFFGGLKEFIWLVELTIRNIFVLLHTITDILFAKKIRTVGVSRNRLDFVKSMIKAFAQKTMYISEVTYISMKTRGFSSGNIKSEYRFKVTISELLVVFSLIIMSILERILK
ncbi:cobalt transport protein [Caldicellulosiruptor kronotskyensis 2002]|uniref:Cobalt transport protein n=1 Tax=Caldicellulosiruptor kronotskyensis (strain DSM 18902 / VKM B-2412 / 2002) TaxID=632348 RepID=E4SFW4_CALK2|nr:energy-coupling factor transporter transmembrane component T [Caldicellulosiruptor kronotskyensis]ADQ46639.1 cobalt transport protein [Caldicellulosiruptor kronotskyensis 2002]